MPTNDRQERKIQGHERSENWMKSTGLRQPAEDDAEHEPETPPISA